MSARAGGGGKAATARPVAARSGGGKAATAMPVATSGGGGGAGSARAGGGSAAPPPSQRWDLTTVGQAEIARAAFGDNLLSDLAANGIDPRGIYEPSTPDTQCSNVIGDVNNETHCWICGLLILYKEDCKTSYPELLKEFVDRLNIEEKQKAEARQAKKGGALLVKTETVDSIVIEPGQCEHRLPIIQAIMLMAVFIVFVYKALLATVGAAVAAASYLEGLRREYAWAHQQCNMIKNDDVYIYQAMDGKFYVDRAKIMILLRKIWNKQDLAYKYSRIFVQYLHKKYPDFDSFLRARVPAMTADLQDICDHLNASGTRGEGGEGGVFAPGLLVLSAAVSARHGPMHKAAAAAVSGRAGGSSSSATVPRTDLGSPDALFAALLRKFKRICSGPHDSYINESFGEMRDEAVAFYAAAIALSDNGDTNVAATKKIQVVHSYLARIIIEKAKQIAGTKRAAGVIRASTLISINANFGTLETAFGGPRDDDMIARYRTFVPLSLDPEDRSEGGGGAGGGGGGAASFSRQPTFISEITEKMQNKDVQQDASFLSSAESDELETIASLGKSSVISKGLRQLIIPKEAPPSLNAPRHNGNVGFGATVRTAAKQLHNFAVAARVSPEPKNGSGASAAEEDPTEVNPWVDNTMIAAEEADRVAAEEEAVEEQAARVAAEEEAARAAYRAAHAEEAYLRGDLLVNVIPATPAGDLSEGFRVGAGRGGARRGRGRSRGYRKTKVLRTKKRVTRRKDRRL